MSLAPDTFHEFQIPPNLFDANGVLTIMFRNENQTALLFSMDEGMEVLFSEGGFGFNFIRGIGIIFCWMILLATLGLAAASFLSFPVAAFLSIGLYWFCHFRPAHSQMRSVRVRWAGMMLKKVRWVICQSTTWQFLFLKRS